MFCRAGQKVSGVDRRSKKRPAYSPQAGVIFADTRRRVENFRPRVRFERAINPATRNLNMLAAGGSVKQSAP